ncbi:MAG TPA: methyltetrahydrofolate--corrinoid methyltransferase [Eggerthellaceae bacterium]|nr:methyltetrahydrofolate--corrinoid methyltransferase [Eggerthellaceae bacterium]
MIIIGEKINGSIPKCGAAIAARDEEYIREMARIQDQYGSTYIDCCASVNVDELETMEWLIGLIMEETDLPIAVDSPDPQVCVDAMKFCGDRVGLINSVSGEGDKIDIVFPKIADTKWGCVALLSDDTGIPADADGRIKVFHDIMARAKEFNIDPSRLYIDPLVETLGANPDALDTICDCTRRIKEEYPTIHVVGALSNISFGLPVRKMINMPFMTLCMAAGMDAAVMDPTNRDMNGVMHATEALLGEDEFCMEYLEAYRDNLFGPINRD